MTRQDDNFDMSDLPRPMLSASPREEAIEHTLRPKPFDNCANPTRSHPTLLDVRPMRHEKTGFVASSELAKQANSRRAERERIQ